MIVLHTIWTDSQLYLWGERREREGCPEDRSADPDALAENIPEGYALGEVELRRLVGDLWDSLLISEATGSRLILHLPHDGNRPLHSGDQVNEQSVKLAPLTLDALTFAPADAVELLTTLPHFERRGIGRSASLDYWSRVALLALELLARQRFVPDLHETADREYRGFWRVVVDDLRTSQRLSRLIEAMPPVCRALAPGEGAPQASALLENFLWTTVDALVRRFMEGDELTHALQDRSAEDDSRATRWLRSLVRGDARLDGGLEDGSAIWEAVRRWLSRIGPPGRTRNYRTCLRLHPPGSGGAAVKDEEQEGEEGPPDTGPASERQRGGWRLTFHVQALHAKDVVLDAEQIYKEGRGDPLILQRPFEGAKEQLRADLELAARYFPPLSAVAQEADPTGCALTPDEAYQFLRDALPMLEHDNFGVWVPRSWRSTRSRIGLRLHLRPPKGPAPAAAPSMGLSALVEYDWRIALGDEELLPEEITRLARAKTPLVQLRGQWIEVQPSDTRAALKLLETQRQGRMTVFEALRQGYLRDDLETGLPVLGIRADGWIDRLLDATELDERVERLSPPNTFVGRLRPYQTKGLEWFRFLARHGLGACLADDMGLGKTIQLIALWLKEREEGESPGPTLLVVPMSLVGNWQRETERFGPSLKVMVHHGLDRLSGQAFVDEVKRYDVVISTYGLIHRDREHLSRVHWHRVALDEAQAIKNPAAKQSAAVRSLRAIHRVALTGTPVENRLSELWSIMEFLNPGYLGSAREFHRRFAVGIEKRHDEDAARRLRCLIRPFVLRRLKSDPDILVDLPDKMEMKVFCNLTREQAALYEALVSDMLGQIDQSRGIARRGLILAALVKLKQICNHPALFLAEANAPAYRSGKCARLTEMLEEVVAEGDCALVFTQFRKMGHLLKALLQERLDREILFFHGGTPQKHRESMIERFQQADGSAPVMLLSLKAGGVGLNLTAARHVFHFDRWWNPAVEDQATDRTHRIGQYKQVQVHKYVCIGTLEERIDAMIESKRNLAENIVGGGEEWLTELSTGALRDLFALSREAMAEE
ncbi:MAG: DEAD/DEAH box helicase [Phycisphaerales bacterium]|nr:MAG: DEAD/DEAH box helicase [Phycisphaerales bacterium]